MWTIEPILSLGFSAEENGWIIVRKPTKYEKKLSIWRDPNTGEHIFDTHQSAKDALRKWAIKELELRIRTNFEVWTLVKVNLKSYFEYRDKTAWVLTIYDWARELQSYIDFGESTLYKIFNGAYLGDPLIPTWRVADEPIKPAHDNVVLQLNSDKSAKDCIEELYRETLLKGWLINHVPLLESSLKAVSNVDKPCWFIVELLEREYDNYINRLENTVNSLTNVLNVTSTKNWRRKQMSSKVTNSTYFSTAAAARVVADCYLDPESCIEMFPFKDEIDPGLLKTLVQLYKEGNHIFPMYDRNTEIVITPEKAVVKVGYPCGTILTDAIKQGKRITIVTRPEWAIYYKRLGIYLDAPVLVLTDESIKEDELNVLPA